MGGSNMQEGMGAGESAIGAALLATGNPAGAPLLMNGVNTMSSGANPQGQQPGQQGQQNPMVPPPAPPRPPQAPMQMAPPAGPITPPPPPQAPQAGMNPKLQQLMALIGGGQ